MSATRIPVRGYHLDVYGHVNNARYLEFLEEARWAYFGEHADLNWWQQRGKAFVVVNINIDYRAPANIGDVLDVGVEVVEIGQRSSVIRQVVSKQDGTVSAEARVTFVVLDIASGRATPIEGDLREQLERLAAHAAES
jgi:thioesterase-3